MSSKHTQRETDFASKHIPHKTKTLPPLPWTDKTKLPKLAYNGPVARLNGSLAHSRKEALQGSDALLRAMVSRPEILNPLLKACTVRNTKGRPRNNGHFILAYIWMVACKATDWRNFYVEHFKNAELRALCGFTNHHDEPWMPSESTLYDRFAELEQFDQEIGDATAHLIQRGRRATRGLIGRWIWVDATQV